MSLRSSMPDIEKEESQELEEIAQSRVNFAFFDTRSELDRATDAYNAL